MDTSPRIARVRVGVGGWTFAPWRGRFYPPGLPQSRELAHASRALRVLEIDGTYYGSQKPATFARWRDETPDDFVFAPKASRFATNRRVLAEAGDSVRRFVEGGVTELGPKLGPILWQFAPTKRFDADDFGAFLSLLPPRAGGLELRHAVDVRHESFRCPEYLALARRHRVATVFTESDRYPRLPDVTGDFVYVRVMRTQSSQPEGLPGAVLDGIARCARRWSQGGEPDGLPRIEPSPADTPPRDTFVFFIGADKEMAPAAAQALQRRIDALG